MLHGMGGGKFSSGKYGNNVFKSTYFHTLFTGRYQAIYIVLFKGRYQLGADGGVLSKYNISIPILYKEILQYFR